MHFKQIGILIGGGGLLIFAAVLSQSERGTENVHEPRQAEQTLSAIPAAEDRASLTVSTPQGFRSEDHAAGVTFVEDGNIRSPMRVTIDLHRDANIPNTDEERRLADGLARYKIEELEGGSGGSLWQLSAVKDSPKGKLVMLASKQAELGPPDFSLAWKIFEDVKIEN